MKTFQKSILYSLISFTFIASVPFSVAAAPFTHFNASQTNNPNVPKADFSMPVDGEKIMVNAPLIVRFKTPVDVTATSLTLNNRQLLYYPLWAGQEFNQVFFDQTYAPGQQTLILTLENEHGERFQQEKHFQVISSSVLAIQSPSPNQIFPSNAVVPIQFTPSNLNETHYYLIRIDGQDVEQISKPSYLYNYRLLEPQRSEMRVSVVAMDENDQALEEESVYIKINLFKNGVTIAPIIKEGSAALIVGEKATFVADVRNDRTGAPLTPEQAKMQIDQIDFYLNDQKIGSDTTLPYEYTWSNNSPLGYNHYSNEFKLRMFARTTDFNHTNASTKAKKVQIMPRLGRDYCKINAPVWSSEHEYKTNDLVRYNGFFYKANIASQNMQPMDPAHKNAWRAQDCDKDILGNSEIKIKLDPPKKITTDEVVTINGKVTIPKGISLEKLTVLENFDWHMNAREIKVNQDGSFSFIHKFKGEGECYKKLCDMLYFKATNNLGYQNKASTSIFKDIGIEITDIFILERYGRVNLVVDAKNNGNELKVEVFNGGEKIMEGYTNGGFSAQGSQIYFQSVSLPLPFDLQPGNYNFRVVMTDENGVKAEKTATVQVPDSHGY